MLSVSLLFELEVRVFYLKLSNKNKNTVLHFGQILFTLMGVTTIRYEAFDDEC